jgi:hypothetical protein
MEGCEKALDAGLEQIRSPVSFACPECHGVLLDLKDGGGARFWTRFGRFIAETLESNPLATP